VRVRESDDTTSCMDIFSRFEDSSWLDVAFAKGGYLYVDSYLDYEELQLAYNFTLFNSSLGLE